MRKFLVVLLILSVVGGAFAEDSKGTWGDLSGEIQVGTTIDLRSLSKDISGDEPFAGMWGGLQGDNFLRIQWDYEKGNWAIRLPFQADANGIGTRRFYKGEDSFGDWQGGLWDDGARVTYTNGGIEVGMSFGMHFNLQSETLINWAGSYAGQLRAEYTADNFKFGTRFDIPLGSDWNAWEGGGWAEQVMAGGWYKFSNASELQVSYNGQYGSEWWRASSIVLGEVDGAWENVEGNGIIYRYFAMNEQLQFGLAFAGRAGDVMFGKDGEGIYAAPPVGYGDNFMYGFLGQATLGARFTIEDGIDISFMLGLRNLYQHGEEKKFYIPLHLGFGYTLGVGAGIGILFDASMGFEPKDINAITRDNKPDVNLGLRVVYGDLGLADGFWGGLQLTALNLAEKAKGQSTGDNYSGLALGLRVLAGFNINQDDGWDSAFDAKKDNAVYAALSLGSNDLAVKDGDLKAEFDLHARFGYNALPLIADHLSLSAEAGIDLELNNSERYNNVFFGFYVEPKLEWNPINDKSTITFAYRIGADTESKWKDSDRKFGLGEHKITVGFKWVF